MLKGLWQKPAMNGNSGKEMLQKRISAAAIEGGASRVAGGLLLLVTAASCVPAANQARVAPGAAPAAALAGLPLPKPEPLLLQPLAPDTAMAMNAAIPISDGYNPPARPFLSARGAIDRMRSIDCLTAAVYYEAASESDDGQRAVAQVVLNRVRHPAYPASVCGVVYQGSERTSGCQFSFTCDGSLLRTPSVGGWARARRIAAAALSGSVYAPVGHATHYHTYKVLPHWAPSLIKSAVIGAHIFYRWNNGWGEPSAFRQAYRGLEPIPGPKPPTLAALPVSSVAIHAEIAAVLAAGQQPAAAHQPASAPVLATASAAELPEPGGPSLPDSQVLDAWKHSGMPRDELPAAR